MGIFEVFNKIDKLSDDELKELYVSLSTNRREIIVMKRTSHWI
jgi:hypothetical protein